MAFLSNLEKKYWNSDDSTLSTLTPANSIKTAFSWTWPQFSIQLLSVNSNPVNSNLFHFTLAHIYPGNSNFE